MIDRKLAEYKSNNLKGKINIRLTIYEVKIQIMCEWSLCAYSYFQAYLIVYLLSD